MDNDAKMLKRLGNQITNLQVKYRALSLDEQMSIQPALVQLLEEYGRYQAKLVMIGIITTDDDLKEIQKLKKGVDEAANQIDMLAAIGNLISFIVVRA